MAVKLSILIPSLASRSESLGRLVGELNRQAQELHITDKVEILCEIDNGEKSIGEKWHTLMKRKTGEYFCRIDDDDEISSNYLKLVFEKIMPDCCSLTGIYEQDGVVIKPFVHSITHKEYSEDENYYYRPPNHLNVMRSEVADPFVIDYISHGEDTSWAMRIAKAGVLKNEAKITEVLYHYKYKSNK